MSFIRTSSRFIGGQFLTLIGLTWKLVPLCTGLHDENQGKCCDEQLHVCLKEQQERQRNEEMSFFRRHECINLDNLSSCFNIKLTVEAEFRVVVNSGSPPTLSCHQLSFIGRHFEVRKPRVLTRNASKEKKKFHSCTTAGNEKRWTNAKPFHPISRQYSHNRPIILAANRSTVYYKVDLNPGHTGWLLSSEAGWQMKHCACNSMACNWKSCSLLYFNAERVKIMVILFCDYEVL